MNFKTPNFFLQNQLKNTVVEKPAETVLRRSSRFSKSFVSIQTALFLIRHELSNPTFLKKTAEIHPGREASRDRFEDMLEIQQIFCLFKMRYF